MKQHHFHHNFHKKFHSYIYKWQNNLSIIRCNIATNRCNCNNVMFLFKDGWYIAIASLSFNSSKKIISHNNEIIRGRWMVAKKQMIVYWAVIALRYLTSFVVSVDKPTCPSVLTLIKFKYFIIFTVITRNIAIINDVVIIRHIVFNCHSTFGLYLNYSNPSNKTNTFILSLFRNNVRILFFAMITQLQLNLQNLI